MSGRTFHIEKAERNERFYRTHDLRVAGFNEWAAVVIFYSAMHYVDAVLAQESGLSNNICHPSSHQQRFAAIKESPNLVSLWPIYRNLYDRGFEARYTLVTLPDHVLSNLDLLWFRPLRQTLRDTLHLPSQ